MENGSFTRINDRVSARSERIVIGMEEFVKTLYSFLFGPDDMFGGTGHVFDATQGGGYAKLFGNNGEILPTLTNEAFARYAGIWFICAEARELWRVKSRDSKDPALERRWMFFYSLGEALRIAYASQGLATWIPPLRAMSNPSWIKQLDNSPVKKIIARHCKLAFKSLSDSYKEASKEQAFKHRNWFRTQATLTSVTEHMTSSWTLLSDHGEDYILPQ